MSGPGVPESGPNGGEFHGGSVGASRAAGSNGADKLDCGGVAEGNLGDRLKPELLALGEKLDWEELLKGAEAFAREQINRRCWRGAREGVLPDGYDAGAIASEAVLEVLGERANGAASEGVGRLEWKLKGA